MYCCVSQCRISRNKIPIKLYEYPVFLLTITAVPTTAETGMILAEVSPNKLVTSPTQMNGHQEQRKEQSKLMRKLMVILALALLVLSSAVVAGAQTPVETPTYHSNPTTVVTQTPTTVTKTVQNPDGTYTIIEYPVGKEVQLTLNPVALTNSKGVATILRDDNGTRIVLNLTDVPADVNAINLYAVDDTGAVSSLGPVVLANGTGKFSGTTPLSKFMLIASPDESLATYDPNTKIFFRSAVPQGFAVIPRTMSARVKL